MSGDGGDEINGIMEIVKDFFNYNLLKIFTKKFYFRKKFFVIKFY